MKRAWGTFWHSKADRLRQGWVEYVAAWEADTEPGYPLPPLARDLRRLGLAMADLYDAIGGRR